MEILDFFTTKSRFNNRIFIIYIRINSMLSIYNIVYFKKMKNVILFFTILIAMGFNWEKFNLSFIINVFLHEIFHFLIYHICASNTSVKRAIHTIFKFQP